MEGRQKPGAAGGFLLLLEVCCAQPMALQEGWELMGMLLEKCLALCSHQTRAELRGATRALFSASVDRAALSLPEPLCPLDRAARWLFPSLGWW